MNYYQRLGGYLSAENCADTNCSHHSNGVRGESGSPNSQIAALLRSMLRDDVELSPRFLAELIGISAPIDTLVSLLATGICRSRHEELSAILHDEMVCHATDERKAAAMLDLASDQDIAPLTLDELVKFFPGDISNQLKRALFRYLATVTLAGADSLLIEYAATLDDIGDSLYWTVAAANQGLCEDVIARALPEAMGDVRHLVPKPFPDSVSGLKVMQFGLWGDFARPGEGDSGGLSMLLSSLGDALSAEAGIGQIVTVTHISDPELVADHGWLEQRPNGHLILRVPAAAPRTRRGAALPATDIEWWLKMLLPSLGLVPDVAHLRFATDVTLRAARAVMALGVKTVFTVAPDPHRTILAANTLDSGQLDPVGLETDLHRIFVAELLADWADGVVAIPSVNHDLEMKRYYPEVVGRSPSGRIESIPEGIRRQPHESDDADSEVSRRILDTLFSRTSGFGLAPSAHDVQLLLNVGRWNRMKQQDMLVEAWLRSGLWESTALVTIGGSIAAPTAAERRMRERVQGLLSAGPPVARQHFAWLPRLSNDSVRLFERSLAAAFPAGPPVYVCSSLKEEFGIAVLEAMDAGLLAIAPRSGGASWYIKPGMTGFLADTSSAWSLATDLSAILGQHQSQRALAAIARQGQKTVQAEYGIESSARKFAAYYRRLLSPSPSHSAAEADAALLK